MTDAEMFTLSRVYALGWNAANMISTNEHGDLDAVKTAALNPFDVEPQRSRWSDGFQAAVRK